MNWRRNSDGALEARNHEGELLAAVVLRGNGYQPTIYSRLQFGVGIDGLVCARLARPRASKHEAMAAALDIIRMAQEEGEE